MVEPVAHTVPEAKEFLELESPEEYWAADSGVFRIPSQPDYHHKEDVSGGMWYGVEVPNGKDAPPCLRNGTTQRSSGMYAV
ncbi:MAG TPA: hypothetical protein VJ124_24735 [Pyrinomonadaceae bacterium]|nr:hypothetical protein [Pyrinomonadaceae bacterium]